MTEKKLPPGTYIRDEFGTVHPYNKDAIEGRVATNVSIFKVLPDEATNLPVTTSSNRLIFDEKIDVIEAALLAENYSANKEGKIDLKDLSKRLGFNVSESMLHSAKQNVELMNDSE